jgi:hypothetical protein
MQGIASIGTSFAGFHGFDSCAPASAEELARFAALQRGLAPMFRRVFADPLAPRTVIVVPSMSLDREELAKLTGAAFYEERLLCLTLLLRMPATRVVYVTSRPVAPAIVDYYLGLLPNAMRGDACRRLAMMCCYDRSGRPLTESILARPQLVERMRDCVTDPTSAHITCFNVTPLERTLAVRLGFPIYGCDPALAPLGTKSGSRDVFAESDVAAPPGFGHLQDEHEMVEALVELRRTHPDVGGAVVKLEEGFSGEGNAIFRFDGAPDGPSLASWVRDRVARTLRFVAPGESWESYRAKFARMGGIVESLVTGRDLRSPSVQCRIDPLGGVQVVSTHDQLLGGETGQVFLGCTFPAQAGGRAALHEAGRRVARTLASHGVVGRFGVDFMVARDVDGWRCNAIEINLRKGGTTHPYLTLQHLTQGTYEAASGAFRTSGARVCHYLASDNVRDSAYTSLAPDEVVDAARRAGLGWDAESERGVVFHLLGAMPAHGKLGAMAIGRSPGDARKLFDAAITLLDREAERREGRRRATHAIAPRQRASSSRMASSTVAVACT